MAAPAVSLTRTDESTADDVLSELEWNPKLDSSNIGVAVKDGVVTLTGYVSSYWEREEAEETAKRVYGVRAVANDLKIKYDELRTDSDIAADAVRALDRHILVPSDNIKVTVRSGWVTLEGTARWQFQKKLAESAVKKLRGVIGITNEIAVKGQLSAEVKSRIEDALRRSAELDARRITVEAEGDTITLRGSVRSWAEKNEAERAAWSVDGITKIENEISVIP
ncbi:MAG TPA: BON domain-containing protein [Bryobacteraceae bacterium]|jgi:osmotically-inducible protein OsmY|nr:BON domain-containing protein [Bryobacteraceae bacterium]